MATFSSFFVVLLASIFFATVSKKVHFPWVIALIVAGVVIGPFGFQIFAVDDTMRFMSESGLVLLMFMAGLEGRLSTFKGSQGGIFLLALINGLVPLLVGFLVTFFFGYPVQTALLVGIIFVSSSVAVVVPSLESSDLIHTPLGSAVLMTSIIQDVASLVLLSIFLQSEDHLTELPLIIFYPLLILVLVLIRYLLPKIQRFILEQASDEEDLFDRDVRAILLVLFGTVVLFDLLGLHPIIAGFFSGLVLSEAIDSQILRSKIRAISYGIFIPMFFIVVGTQTDINLLLKSGESLLLSGVIVLASILAKFFSGSIGAKLVGFRSKQAAFFGVTSIPQLSTTLAAAFTAQKLNLLSSELVTTMVALSVVTTTISPVLVSIMTEHLLSEKDLHQTKV